jgi:tetratricopeptide (TPR) repeat protein
VADNGKLFRGYRARNKQRRCSSVLPRQHCGRHWTKRVCAIAVIWVSSSFVALASEANSPQRLEQILQLQKQGKYREVVTSLASMDQSGLLTGSLRGQMLTMSGFDYQALGEFDKARSSYEQAIESFHQTSRELDSYALALISFANLEAEEGFLEEATRLDTIAVEVYRETGSSAGMAQAYAGLASRELDRHHWRQAARYLSLAEKTVDGHGAESKDDFKAEIVTLQGRLAEARGDRRGGIAQYQKAIGLWQASVGEHQLASGLAYMQLGEAQGLAGDKWASVDSLGHGLWILDDVVGRHSPK